jgi:hypothetical protein
MASGQRIFVSTATQYGRAWVALCLALALHVSDEATTGFLSVYNPTVQAIRARYSWFPMPVFGFTEWLTGLICAVVVLLLLSPFFFRGARWTRPLAYFAAAIMLLNGLGHTAGTIMGRSVASVHFARPMPGFYSSPFLLAASVYLFLKTRALSRKPSAV